MITIQILCCPDCGSMRVKQTMFSGGICPYCDVRCFVKTYQEIRESGLTDSEEYPKAKGGK